MPSRSPALRLADRMEAIELVRADLATSSLEAFAADTRQRWIVERGLEIVSEASRRLPEALKRRHPAIPWRKVAGIGNILRHDDERVAADLLWHLVLTDLPALEAVCRLELERTRSDFA